MRIKLGYQAKRRFSSSIQLMRIKRRAALARLSVATVAWQLHVALEWLECVRQYNIAFRCVMDSWPPSPTTTPAATYVSSSIRWTDWALNPHWWDCGGSSEYSAVKSWVWEYATCSNRLKISNAWFNGFSLNFNLLSLDVAVMPPTYQAVAFTDILAGADPPIKHAKLESVLL